MEKIKLYVDEDITDLLSRTLRSRGFDVISAHEVGMRGRTDKEQLNYAIKGQRAILSCNIKHFCSLAKDYFEGEIEHFGIIVTNQVDFPILLYRTIKLIERLSPQQIYNRFEWLHNYK